MAYGFTLKYYGLPYGLRGGFMKKKARKSGKAIKQALAVSKVAESELEYLAYVQAKLEVAEARRRRRLERLIHKRNSWRSYVV